MEHASPFKSPPEIVGHFLDLWADGDLDSAFNFVHGACVYTLNVTDELMPIGGEHRGKAHIKSIMQPMREIFDYRVFRPTRISDADKDGNVRVHLEYVHQHRPSGEMISGTCRFVFKIEHGVIVKVDEFHDRAKLESFLRLYGSPAKDKPQDR